MDYEKNGTIYTFTLDLDKVADKEESDKGYSFNADLESMLNGEIRMAVFRRMASFIGSDFNDLKAKGLGIDDLMNILKGCFAEVGFFSETAA